MKYLNIQVEGINCNGCVSKINNFFSDVEGISVEEVNIENQLVQLICEEDISNMTIRTQLIELGFNVMSIRKK